MSSAKRPYLLRAYYDWFLDNDLTPYLVVNALYPNTKVPQDFVRDGQIVLNIAPAACGNLQLGNETIQFTARFRGVPQNIVVPLGAAIAIYARENGDGVLFEDEEAYQTDVSHLTEQPKDFTEAVDPPKTKRKADASHLKIIK
ncbi:ClpXP protease specificity-enhancing factor [Spirabiliibacterium falconis]|uniref:ClpXP protease specificity-enhancing factor n=1 Tax=Spirabiliibacterium falconis TaxID=572023 RepID=UPI001AADFCC7|nr:ClpXP protease specificity-enhancing factor [Spirabiliibacterium falconis]MBE2894044.1 ClpXP protease specificity-enhancing factor [Spirabiliibacterium falconis]